MKQKTYYIDFDATICPNRQTGKEYGLVPPTEACVSFIKSIKAKGHKICIFSIRSNANHSTFFNGHKNMMEYLEKHGIPFDDVCTSKPKYSVLIDDKSIGIPLDEHGNVDWTKLPVGE
jgi:hypothetical protein